MESPSPAAVDDWVVIGDLIENAVVTGVDGDEFAGSEGIGDSNFLIEGMNLPLDWK